MGYFLPWTGRVGIGLVLLVALAVAHVAPAALIAVVAAFLIGGSVLLYFAVFDPARRAGRSRSLAFATTKPGTVGSWAVAVESVVPDATQVILAAHRENQPPPAGRQLVMASVRAEYSGPGVAKFDPSYLVAVDLEGARYPACRDSCGVLPAPDLFRIKRKASTGTTISGNVCWSVDAEHVQGLCMVARVKGGDPVWFALE